MSPWLRLLVAFAGLIVAALILKASPPLLVLVLLIAGLTYANYRFKVKPRRDASQSGAQMLGLQYSVEDPFGLLGYPFALFSRGIDREIGNVVHGRWNGMDVKEFDYSYATVSPIGGGDERRRFSCAIAPVDVVCPNLVVEPETFLTSLADRATLRDVEFESERFNRVFEVNCDDREFAHALIDVRMMEWLLGLDDAWGFEVSGRLVLAYGPQEQPWEVSTVLDTIHGFIERIPRVVTSRDSTPPIPDGPDLPPGD